MHRRSMALSVMGVWFLIRGTVSLIRILPVLGSLSVQHSYYWSVLVESVLWIGLAVGLFSRKSIAILLAIGWSFLQVIWASYGFAVTSSWRVFPRLAVYVVGSGISIAIIVVLLRLQVRSSEP